MSTAGHREPASMGKAGRTLVEILRSRADEQPGASACWFLSDGQEEGSRLSFAELDAREMGKVRALATDGIGTTHAEHWCAPALTPADPASGADRRSR